MSTSEASVILERMHRRDSYKMPPLATSLPDEHAIQVIGDWIRGLANNDKTGFVAY